jgi:hypothetical protein
MLQESKANDSSVDCVRMETETHFNLATYYIAMKWMSKAGGRHLIFATSPHLVTINLPKLGWLRLLAGLWRQKSTLASLDLHSLEYCRRRDTGKLACLEAQKTGNSRYTLFSARLGDQNTER